MKTKTVLFCILVAAVISQCISSHNSESQKYLFDYFGQIPPKDTAEIFAPGIISDTVKKAWSLAVSPNGDEVFFSRGQWPNTKIMYMKKTGDSWSLPDTAGFSRDCLATEPAFSPDGRYLYFSSSKENMDIFNYSLWRIRKIKDVWSQPEKLFDIGGDSIWEFHPSVTSDGSLYFCNWDNKHQSGSIYMSQCDDNKCSDPVRIDKPISTGYSDVNPFISHDGRYMIFTSNRPGGYGDYDRYISFRNDDWSWTSPKNLGPEFNTKDGDSDMDVSPDGKYIFVYLNGNIYWMPVGELLLQ